MVRVLAALACPVIANAAPAILHYRFRITDKLHEVEIASLEAAMADPVENWYYQTLDHTNASNTKVWYSSNSTNSSATNSTAARGSPDFLYIEGEGEGVAAIGGVVWALHKRAGQEAQGDGRVVGASTANPNPLTDLVRFQDYFAVKQNLTKSKWVAFGESYPGMLATWLKLKCLASIDTIQAGTTELDRLVASDQADDAATLKALYNPCTPFTNDDDRSVFETQVFGAFQGAAQYAADGTTDLTRICNKIAAFSVTPVETLSQFVGTTGGDTCSYSDL
ncbi:hypothetical protein DYB32_004519 [Aphanomyces invadans]|uniref:Uncharacterized protein n=1 Tax=Aphanomyces invadans TaxID=157072 RepID=A0A418AXJ8_9STRA|nr:hypothetical protein DYB32_004519 [Aphanomyces invadans]